MRNTGTSKILYFPLLLLVFFSCRTTTLNDQSTPMVSTFNPEETLEQFYNQNQYTKGLSELVLVKESLDSEIYEHWETQFLNAINIRLMGDHEKESWPLLIKEYQTLKTLLPEGQMPLNEESFYALLLESFYKLNYVSAAETILLDHNPLKKVVDEKLQLLETYFIEQNKYTAAGLVQKEMTQRELPITPTLDENSTTTVKKSDLVTGTVTIWVDRGIKMENGMGVPDRVLGSGFFIDNQGYVITNYHVIASEVDPSYEGYSHLYIKRDDQEGEKIPAKVIGWDPQMDLALIKTEIRVPYSFSFAPKGVYELGESIFAIGSPGGLEKTLTTGTISAGERYLLPMGKSLQVDVPINPGNSGGPLLNQKGQVIGVVFAGIEEFEGINFAIPVEYLKMLLPRLYAGGKVDYGWMGAALFKDLDKLIVSYTFPDLPAERAGLSAGDQILAVDDIEVSSVTDIQDILMGLPVDSLVRVSIMRRGNPIELMVPLASRPDYPLEYALNHDAKERLILPVFGMKLEPLDNDRNLE